MPVEKSALRTLAEAEADLPNLIRKWRNELHSHMDIKSVHGGNFEGTYTSHVSADGPHVSSGGKQANWWEQILAGTDIFWPI